MPGSDASGGATDPDGRLAARFAAAYSGPSDPADALVWWEHPAEPGPSGANSPAAIADARLRALFAPGAGAGDQAAYEDAARLADADRAATRAALDEIGALEDAAAPTIVEIEPAESDAVEVDPAPGDARRRRRWARPIAVVGVAAFVIGGAATVGLQTIGTAVGYAGPGAAPTPTATLADPRPSGRVLADLSSDQRSANGADGSGFTSYRSAEVDAHGRRVQLGVTCRGEGTVVVVIGSGFVTGSYYAIQCGGSGDSGLRTQLPSPATTEPFRISVFERDPLQWKVVLTATDGF